MSRITIIVALCATLSACGESPQNLVGNRFDATSHSGSSVGPGYTVPGWKAGDKTSWEHQLKARQENSQNDYSRMK